MGDLDEESVMDEVWPGDGSSLTDGAAGAEAGWQKCYAGARELRARNAATGFRPVDLVITTAAFYALCPNQSGSNQVAGVIRRSVGVKEEAFAAATLEALEKLQMELHGRTQIGKGSVQRDRALV